MAMEMHNEQWITEGTCPFWVAVRDGELEIQPRGVAVDDGWNLAALRRVQLRRLASKLGYADIAGLPDASKQDILRLLLQRLSEPTAE